MLLKLSDIFIWFSICAILFISPLLLGSVHTSSFSLFFVLVLFSFFVFILRSFLIGELNLKKTHLEVPLLLLILYVTCQLIVKTHNFENRFFFGTIYKYATLNEAFKLIIYFLFYILIVNMANSKRDILRLLWTIVVTGGIISIFGLLQRVSGEDIFRLAGIETNRQLFSTFINRNHFAGYIEMVFPLAISILFYKLLLAGKGLRAGKRGHLKNIFSRSAENGSIFIFILLSLMLAAVFLSLSRSGMLLVVLGLFIFYLLSVRDRGHLAEKKFLLAFLEFAILFAVIIVIGIGLKLTLERFSSFSSLKVRLNLFTSVIKMILRYPVFGTGLGTFRYIFPKFQMIYPPHLYFGYAHNEYLQLLSETGIIGFSIFIFGSINYLKRNKFSRDIPVFNKFLRYGTLSGIVLIAVHNLVDFSLRMPSNALTFMLVLALFYLSGKPINGDSDKTAGPYLFRINSKKIISCVILPAYLLFCLIAARIQADIFLADRMANNKSYDMSERYEYAARKDRLNADYKHRLSRIKLEKARGDDANRARLLDEALEHAESAALLAPTNAAYLYNLSEALYEMCCYERAEKFIKQAINYAPERHGYRIGYAVFCFNRAYMSKNAVEKKEYLKQGLEQYKKARKLYSGVSLEGYKKYFINYEKQICDINSFHY